ncbi:MAG: RNA polymerase sigma factor [Planctomycetota bacterium]
MGREPTDLVERAMKGDRTAFARLVQQIQRTSLGVAYAVLRDADLAADAVQDAFIRAFRGLSQLREVDRFESWFLSVVRSSALDLLRRRQRWRSREVALAPALLQEREGERRTGTPDEALLQGEEAARIRAAFDALTPEYREVLLLKHSEGCSYVEIAQKLGTSVRAVESRLFRARIQLQGLLKVRGEPRRVQGDDAD